MNSLPISPAISNKVDTQKPQETRQDGDEKSSFSGVLSKQMAASNNQEVNQKHKLTDKKEDKTEATGSEDQSAALVSLLQQMNTRDMFAPTSASSQDEKIVAGSNNTASLLPNELSGVAGTITANAVQAPSGANTLASTANNSVTTNGNNSQHNAAVEATISAASDDTNLAAELTSQLPETQLFDEQLSNLKAEMPVMNNPLASSQNMALNTGNNLPAANASTATSLNTPMQNSQWGNDFAQKISWLHGQKIQSAELHLNPANLGPVKITLELNQDQQASFVFSSPHQSVRDAIEQALPKLRESLAENGISLGNTSVNDQAAQQQQEQARFMFNNNKKETTSSEFSLTGEVASSSVTAATSNVRKHDGLLDTFA